MGWGERSNHYQRILTTGGDRAVHIGDVSKRQLAAALNEQSERFKVIRHQLEMASRVLCAIVMEPKTGAIRAMVSLPDFNPNNYNKVDNINVFLNSCTQKLYEPGSVFKPIVMAAGLDTNKISPETTYTDTG